NSTNMMTRGKKVSVHHMFGLWLSFIESCYCLKCNEHRAAICPASPAPVVQLQAKAGPQLEESSSKVLQKPSIVKMETVKKEASTNCLMNSTSENESLNVSSIGKQRNPVKRMNSNHLPDGPSMRDAMKIRIDENHSLQDYFSDDDVGIEVANADFDIEKESEDIYTSFRRNADDPLNYVECSVCFKKIKESSMKQHHKTHTGARPHRCDVCGTRFTRRGDVCRHKRVVHGKFRPYVCRKCDKKFPDRSLLISHLINHDKTTFYECSICNFKFGRREYFDNHIRYIHPTARQVNNVVTTEDAAETQLRELEEEDEVSGVNTVATAVHNAEILARENRSSGGKPSVPKEDVNLDAPIPLMQLQTVSKADGNDEDLVGKILNAAVAQATNTLSNLAAVNPARSSSKSQKRNNKYGGKSPLEIVVKASMSGVMRRFVLQIQGEEDFDLQSAEGMDLIVKLVSELGEDKGQVDGPIQVELYKPSKPLL
ncbi:Zinc finger C2H2-type, partial [Trinorchestia longiramus]